VEHPALDAARQGFVDALKDNGTVDGQNVTIDVQIAQGNMATANSIAKAFVGKNVDLIHSIATPASQACVNATRTIPIVISSVTDPVAAGLVKSLEQPGGNVTGTTDRAPIDRQMELMCEIQPKIEKLGFIYNSGEDNSVSSLKQLQTEAAKYGIEVVEATVSRSSGFLMAARSLVGKVDAIHIPTDNTVVSAFEAVVKVCEEDKFLLHAADIDSVPRGAVAVPWVVSERKRPGSFTTIERIGSSSLLFGVPSPCRSRALKGAGAGSGTSERQKMHQPVRYAGSSL
jgi:putative tryptophan/tyrosine transport system substrate-binding protein